MNLVQTLVFFSPASPWFTWIQALCWQDRQVDAGEALVLPARSHESLTGKSSPCSHNWNSEWLHYSAELELISVIITCTLLHDYSQISGTFPLIIVIYFYIIFSAKRTLKPVSADLTCCCAKICFCVNKIYCILHVCVRVCVCGSFQSGRSGLWLQHKNHMMTCVFLI